MSSGETNPTVPGRSCGACSMCCKLLRIDELDKPVRQWCAHCAPGRGGCKIYDSRPSECRSFYCAWLTAEELGEEWRPLNCKMVLYTEGDGNRIALHVDPANPTVWRREPYYTTLKQMALEAAELHRQVVVYIKNRAIVVLPNKEVDIGTLEQGDLIIVGEANLRNGQEWTAFKKLAKDVPPEEAGKWMYKRAQKHRGS